MSCGLRAGASPTGRRLLVPRQNYSVFLICKMGIVDSAFPIGVVTRISINSHVKKPARPWLLFTSWKPSVDMAEAGVEHG